MRWFLLLAVFAARLFAQLSAPNDAGISMGHIHLIVKDPDAMKKAWVDALGAQAETAGPLNLLKLPGIFIIVTKGDSNGGSNGSSVNHIGIAVKDYPAIKAKVAAANLPIQELTPNQQAFVTFPEDVRVELMEVKDQAAPVMFHHIHMSVLDPEETRSWYVKTFGAAAGSRRNLPAAMIPGGEVDFLKARTAPEPTKGRALDHIGFEVKDLQAFCKKLEADGIKFDSPYRDVPNIGLKIAFIIDPVGTRIELTQGLISK